MKKKLGILLIILLLILFFSMYIIKLINKNITPTVMEYSKSEIKRIASIIINKSIDEEIINKIDIDKLFVIDKSSDEEIVTVTLNSIVVNKITNEISDACENNLRLIEERRFDELKNFNINERFFYVPSGIAFNNTFFNSVGPLIPIKLKIVGNVTSGIETEVKEYGINNSLVTISVEIKVELMVILPLSTDYVSITNYVPIAIKMIQGKVPDYYGGKLNIEKGSLE